MDHKKLADAAKWYQLMDIEYGVPSALATPVETPCNQGHDTLATARKLADSANSLEELRAALATPNLCILSNTALNLVFADGTPEAKIMLIGEAPGANEDEQGIPFCGVSGQLLDNMIASIGLSRRKNCYITNTIFWRPPDNRQPSNQEIEICRPFVEKHIALIGPKLIVLVGSVACTALLGKNQQIANMRSIPTTYSNPYIKDVPVIAIFHPAYLIRQPLKKKTAWFDMLALKKFIDELLST
jgi:DNA polymerase